MNQYWISSVRFHPLTEFDEGKRSCRRRLAGHNRRRRKTLPEDTTSRLLLPGNQNTGNADLDIVNLLAVLTRAQGQFLHMLMTVLCKADFNLFLLPFCYIYFFPFGSCFTIHRFKFLTTLIMEGGG